MPARAMPCEKSGLEALGRRGPDEHVDDQKGRAAAGDDQPKSPLRPSDPQEQRREQRDQAAGGDQDAAHQGLLASSSDRKNRSTMPERRGGRKAGRRVRPKESA